MRVLNYCASVAGGAGRAVLNLNKALRESGVDSWIASGDNPDNYPFLIRIKASDAVKPAYEPKLLANQNTASQSRTSISNTLFSMDFIDFDFVSSKQIRSFDVHHLHWTVGFIHPSSVALMLRSGMNVIWTLHDMWTLTGGCHYSAGCHRYEHLCTDCPQLYGESREIVPALHASRIAFLNSPQLVVNAPSQWLSEVARSSRALSNCRHICVPNSVNMMDFAPATPEERQSIRTFHGIADPALVLTCITQDFGEQRKGFALLALALQRVRARVATPLRSLKIVAVGHRSEKLEACGVELIDLGQHSRNSGIRDAIVMSDFVLQLAMEENYSNVIMESLACGVPVIASAIGGNKEIVSDGLNGFLVDLNRGTSQLESILTDLLTCEKLPDLASACLTRASADAPSIVASQFCSEISEAFPHLKSKVSAASTSKLVTLDDSAIEADHVLVLPKAPMRAPTWHELARLHPSEKDGLLAYFSNTSYPEHSGVYSFAEGAPFGLSEIELQSGISIVDFPLLEDGDPFSFSEASRRGPAIVGLKNEGPGATVIGSKAVLMFRTVNPGGQLLLSFDVAFYSRVADPPAISIITEEQNLTFVPNGPLTIEVPLSPASTTHQVEIVTPLELRASDGQTKRLGRLFIVYGELLSVFAPDKTDPSRVLQLANGR